MFSNNILCVENIFTPSNNEFLDSNKYLSNVRKHTCETGFALIKSPKSWRPSFIFNIFSNFSFSTQWIVTPDLKIFPENKKLYKSISLTIDEFVNYAEDFKKDYFNCPPDLVPVLKIENAFIQNKYASTSDIEDDKSKKIYYYSRSDVKALKCASKGKLSNSIWNLEKIWEHSILKNINIHEDEFKKDTFAKMNNVQMEMCFTFKKWKQAKYNSYILDFLIWGDSKSWFIIPPEFSDKIKTLSLDSITDFAAHNISVFKIIQKAGDFVFLQPGVTYCTLSHGANCSQRANYMPIEWLQFGLKSWNSDEQREWKFSFDELMVNLIGSAGEFDKNESAMVFNIAKYIFEEEIRKRDKLIEKGIEFRKTSFKTEKCRICKTICYLSYFGCNKCTEPTNCYCLNHLETLEDVTACCCDDGGSCKYLNLSYTNEELIQKLAGFNPTLNLNETLREDFDINLQNNAENKIDINSNKVLGSISIISDYYENIIDSLLLDDLKDQDDKLTMEQLNLFLGIIGKLSNQLKLQEKLKLLIEKTYNARKDILNFLRTLSPTIENVNDLLNVYSTFPILLPEIDCLTLVKNLLIWIKKLSNLEPNCPIDDISLELIKGESILLNLKNILVSLTIEEDIEIIKFTSDIILKYQNLVEKGKDLEKRGVALFNEEVELSYLEDFLKEAASFKHFFPCLNKLEEAFNFLTLWLQRVESTMNEEPSPYIYIAVKLMKEAKPIGIKIKKISEIEADIEAADVWVKDAFDRFARPNSKITFYEIVAPKVMSSSLLMKQPNAISNRYSTLHQFFIGWNDPCYDPSPTLVANTFKQAESISIVNIKALRKVNELKTKTDVLRGCLVCRQIKNCRFVKCALCYNFCHELDSCSKPTHPTSNSKLCHHCIRSKRPQLEDVYPLLLSLQNIPLRIPEGEALQALAERAAGWQSKVDEVLSSDICAPYMNLVSGENSTDQDHFTEITSSLEANLEELKTCMDKLNDFLIEGYMIEVSLDEIKILEDILQIFDTHIAKLPKTLPENIEIEVKAHLDKDKTLNQNQLNFNSLNKKSELKISKKQAPICKKSMDLKSNELPIKISPSISVPKLIETICIYPKKNMNQSSQRNIAPKKNSSEILKMPSPKSQKDININRPIAISQPKSQVGKRCRASFPMITKKNKLGEQDIQSSEEKMAKVEKSGKGTTMKSKGQKKEEEKIDKCAADNCLNPIGEELDWVMCDNCEKWYHLYCLSLKKSQISEDMDFFCFKCK